MPYLIFRKLTSLSFLITIFFQIVCQPVTAQQTGIHDLYVDYERILHLEGITPAHNVSNQPFFYEYISQIDSLSGHPWEQTYLPPSSLFSIPNMTISLYDPESRSYWRNLKPGGINNGAVWEGRGLTSSFSTGLYFNYRFLSASIRPLIIYNQNQSFALSRYPVRSGRSEFSSPFNNVDTPQRFGSQSFWTFDPGPSYIKAVFKGFEGGFSNQNRWWGPALHYPIIMSNNGPGFWHFFTGTNEPKNVYIGNLETTLIWGKLLESDFFDGQSFNDERYITGITLSLNPRYIPNLTLGISRVFYRTLPPEGIPVNDLFRVFEAFSKISFVSDDTPSGDDEFSQMLSLHGRWVFPESGFEVYGEWSRNDHSWNLRDAIGEPEHSRGYMAGIQKIFGLSNSNLFAINAELVHLETSKTQNVRAHPSYYSHHIVHQGYTHKGQILGVGYGPGSNSQILNGKYYFRDGKISGWFRRTVFNNDFLYRSDAILDQPGNANTPKYWLHNFELNFGASLVYFFDQLETELGIELSREFNNDFIYKNDQTHLALNLRLRYRISSLR